MGWDHGADDTFPDTATKKEEKMLGSRAYFCLCFFFNGILPCFPGAPPQLILRVFFSACLMKRILESSIFHTTRLLNTSEAKKWQAVSMHSHLWRLRSVVTLLLKLFSGEVKFPGSTKTHGKKGPVWFSKCWSFQNTCTSCFFFVISYQLSTGFSTSHVVFWIFSMKSMSKKVVQTASAANCVGGPVGGMGVFFKWWYRITGMKSYHHCQGFAEICHEMVTSHLFRCYSNFPQKKSW